MNRITIAAIPLDIVEGDKAANLAAVADLLRCIRRDTDIVCLPELFTTGFFPDADRLHELAERNTGETMTAIAELARYANVAICGSFIAKTSETGIANRAFFVEPCGDAEYYDKRHLFSISAEHEIMQQGHALPKSVRFRGWNIAVTVCYDLRFPVWERNVGQRYDIMVVPANWPQAREYAWSQLLSARAIENQAVYVGANRSGCDRFGCYDSTTAIYDPMGKPISECDQSTGIVYATYEKSSLEELRAKLPFGLDADTFDILL